MLELLGIILLVYLFLKLTEKVFPSDGTLFDRWFY